MKGLSIFQTRANEASDLYIESMIFWRDGEKQDAERLRYVWIHSLNIGYVLNKIGQKLASKIRTE